ncbi:MAG: DUF3179 domain-containing protein [Bacteroidota bacterium]
MLPRLALCALALTLAACATAQDEGLTDRTLPGFSTNTAQRAIDLGELRAGGPPKDGIPSIDEPVFVSAGEAADWLEPQEPVVALTLGGETRAYPLQILTWHEIVNDVFEGGAAPVAVTFCPLCYSAVAFDRRVETEGGTRTLTFGVSGFLRYSDLVMFDRETETLWQQLTGDALVGDLLGTQLTVHPAQIVSFEQFRAAYPESRVLSRETGHTRDYGRNPYAGYDDIDRQPFLFDGPEDDRLRPMEKVVALKLDGAEKAYPYTLTREQRVVNDEAAGTPLVVFHADGAVSALDAAEIAASRQAGSTGVFDRRAGGQTLTFQWDDGFVDTETGSRWDVTGRAVAGPLAGTQLARLPHGDYFAFAWLAFKPETEIYR